MRCLFKLSFLFIIFLYSCNHPIEKVLPGKWNVTKVEYPESDKILNSIPFIKNDPDVNAAIALNYFGGDFLDLKSDQTYTSLTFGHLFFYGKWLLDKKTNSIDLLPVNSGGKDTIVLKIDKFGADELMLQQKIVGPMLLKQNQDKPLSPKLAVTQKLTFSRDKQNYNNDDADYTSIQNNKWRIKPTAPETVTEINKRVRESLEFAIKYLINNREANDGISLRPIAIPVNIAINGIEMQTENEINSSWKEIFYDDVDAMTGYHIIESAFRRSFDRPKSEELGATLDIFYLKQLLGNIK